MFLHLSVVLGTLFPIPFGGFFIPLIYWWMNYRENAVFQIQAKSLLNFQLLFNILGFVFTTFFWCYFIKCKSSGFEVCYVNLWLFLAICVVINIIYPLFIVIRMSIERKIRDYYPRGIRILK